MVIKRKNHVELFMQDFSLHSPHDSSINFSINIHYYCMIKDDILIWI